MLPLIALLLTFAVFAVADPVRKVQQVKFETDAHLDYQAGANVNVREIVWFRNDLDMCTPNSRWCFEETNKTYYGNTVTVRSRLYLWNVTTDANYTCVVITRDGRNSTVSETEVIVVPNYENRTHLESGSDDTIYCNVRTPNLQVRLLRDGREFCTPYSHWCLQRNGTRDLDMYFDILNLQENHTYTCEAYRGQERLATVSVHRIFVYHSHYTSGTRRWTYSTWAYPGTTPTIAPTAEPTGTTPEGPVVPQGRNIFIKQINIGKMFIFPLRREK